MMNYCLSFFLILSFCFSQSNINNIAYCTLVSGGDMDDSPSIYKINLDSSSIDTILSNSILHDITEDQATLLVSPLIGSDPSLHVISPIILYNVGSYDDTSDKSQPAQQQSSMGNQTPIPKTIFILSLEILYLVFAASTRFCSTSIIGCVDTSSPKTFSVNSFAEVMTLSLSCPKGY